jgi:AcrR family transcriptional regulator
MSVISRTRRMTGDARREQLLDVTKELVGEIGFHGVTIDGIARRAGITRPIVYGHFNDLHGVFEAMLDRESVRALGQLAAIFQPEEIARDPREALANALRAYLEVIRADPVTWKLVLMPPEGAPAVLRERIARDRDAVVEILAELVRPGLAPGRESPDPKLTARMLSAVADESGRLMLTDPDGYPPERLVAHASWLLEQLAPPE